MSPVTRGDDKCVQAGPRLGLRNRDVPGAGSIPKSGGHRAGRQAASDQRLSQQPTPRAGACLPCTERFPSTKTMPAMENLLDPPCLRHPGERSTLCSNRHKPFIPAMARLLTGSVTGLSLLKPTLTPGFGKSSCSLLQPCYSRSEGGNSQAHAASYCRESSRLTPPDSRPTIPMLLPQVPTLPVQTD